MKHIALFFAVLFSLGVHWAVIRYVPAPFEEGALRGLPKEKEPLPVDLENRPIPPPNPPPTPKPPPKKVVKPLPPPPPPPPPSVLAAQNKRLEEVSLGRRQLRVKIPLLSPRKRSGDEELVRLKSPESAELSSLLDKVGEEAGLVGEEEGRRVALLDPVLRDLASPSKEKPEDAVRRLEDEVFSKEFMGLRKKKPRQVTEPVLVIKGPAASRRVIYKPAFPEVSLGGEGEIALKFWVLPDGTVGRVVPFRKGEARLEAMAIQYLKRWRFSPLPPGTPPREEWGIIPFKFVLR
ncbi:MAG: TonB family protein [Nitrospinota bacterium]